MFTLIIISCLFVLVLVGMGTATTRKAVEPVLEDDLEFDALNQSKKLKVSKQFTLRQSLKGQRLTIRVVSQGFEYNHDELLKAVWEDRFGPNGSAQESWKRYGGYNKTIGWPSWADAFIRLIDAE